MDLFKYIEEAKLKLDGPIAGDILELQVNEEIALECDCEREGNDVTIQVDELGYKILDELGLLQDHDEQIETIEQIQSKAEELQDAEYQGKKVNLGKPIRGGSKKFYVYVKDPKTKNVKKVSFGDTTGLSIKRDDPERRKSFRARHNCSNPGPRTKARYWSCRMWSSKPVSKITQGKK
ncbi:MAG: hypothetical protein CMA64_08710 [Euryarchaeota archaeon]|nr:hypothetical protein [Euryarchaeota archaeon]